MDATAIALTAANSSDPAAGLRAVAALRRLADSLELAQVEAALGAGMSWSQMAEALSVSRQAVHKKYAKRVAPGLAPKTRRRA